MKSKRKLIKKILNDHFARVSSIGSTGKLGDFKNWEPDKITLNRRSSIKSAKEDSFVDLKAVNPGMIEEAIVDLIQKVKSNVQFNQVQAICKHQHFIDTIDKIDFKQGDIVTHDGEVAFKLDFKISYNLSLLLDRKGKLINVHRSIAKQIEK